MKTTTQKDKFTSPAYWTQLIQLSLYEMIKDHLEGACISKTQFAEDLGVSKGYVTQILNGDFDHRLSKLVQLGIACGRIPKFEFVPVSEALATLQDTYQKSGDWQKTGRYSNTVTLDRSNPFLIGSHYGISHKYKGENGKWENGDDNSKIA